jgi:hypothetical protein
MTHKKGGRKFRFHERDVLSGGMEASSKVHNREKVYRDFNINRKTGIRTSLKSLAHESVINMKKRN